MVSRHFHVPNLFSKQYRCLFREIQGRRMVSRHFHVPKPVFQAKSLLISRDSRSAQGFAPLSCPKTCFPSKVVADFARFKVGTRFCATFMSQNLFSKQNRC